MSPAESLGVFLRERGYMLAVAESCTGGLLGGILTSVPGASVWFTGGIIAYANSVKTGLLGVDNATLTHYGAVSEPVARQMAHGVCRALQADVGVSVSGIAGPYGGSPEKPVGTVWIGYCVCGHTEAEQYHFAGTREEVRVQATMTAIRGVQQRVERHLHT